MIMLTTNLYASDDDSADQEDYVYQEPQKRDVDNSTVFDRVPTTVNPDPWRKWGD